MTMTRTEQRRADPVSPIRPLRSVRPRPRAGPCACVRGRVAASPPGTARACRSTCSRSTTAASCSGSTTSRRAARCWWWSTPSIPSRPSRRCGASSARPACRSAPSSRPAAATTCIIAPWHAEFTPAKVLVGPGAHPAHRQRPQADAAASRRDDGPGRSAAAVPRPARRGAVPRAGRARRTTRAPARARRTRASRFMRRMFKFMTSQAERSGGRAVAAPRPVADRDRRREPGLVLPGRRPARRAVHAQEDGQARSGGDLTMARKVAAPDKVAACWRRILSWPSPHADDLLTTSPAPASSATAARGAGRRGASNTAAKRRS